VKNYDIGDDVILTATFGIVDPDEPDADPTPYDPPTVTFQVRLPDGTEVTIEDEPEHPAAGTFRTVYLTTTAGGHTWRPMIDGSPKGRRERKFGVRQSAFDS